MSDTQRKLDNISRRKISQRAKMDAAFGLGYADAHEWMMQARIRDEMERRKRPCRFCGQREKTEEYPIAKCVWTPERPGSDYYWISGEGHPKALMPESKTCPYCGGLIIVRGEPTAEPMSKSVQKRLNVQAGRPMMEGVKEPSAEPPTSEPIHEWFCLSYASYLVLPRSVLQSAPVEWQAKFVGLLRDLDEMFSAAMIGAAVSYHVVTRDAKGKYLRDDLADYERGRRRVPMNLPRGGQP